MKIIFVIVLVCFSSGLGFSQSKILNVNNLQNQPIDSSLSWMRAHETSGEHLEEFHPIALNTLKRSIKSAPDSITAQVHESLASWHSYNGVFSPDSVVYHAEKALEYHIKANDKKKIADISITKQMM